MDIKKIVIGSGLVALVGYALLKDKTGQLAEQFKNLTILPTAFKNLDANWNDGKPYVSFKLDLKFRNPTTQAFNVNGVIITLKRVLFYDKNNAYLGGANVNVKALNIPANSSVTIPGIPIILNLQTTIINAINIINTGFNINDVKTEAIIGVLGLEYKITQ